MCFFMGNETGWHWNNSLSKPHCTGRIMHKDRLYPLHSPSIMKCCFTRPRCQCNVKKKKTPSGYATAKSELLLLKNCDYSEPEESHTKHCFSRQSQLCLWEAFWLLLILLSLPPKFIFMRLCNICYDVLLLIHSPGVFMHTFSFWTVLM